MRNRLLRGSMAVATGVAVATVVALSVARPASQGTRVDRIDGRPNLSGIWQANNEANWDLQAHEARAGAVMQPGVYPYDFAQVPAAPSLPFGAAGGVPGSLGVVQGDGEIPYTPEALARKQDNAAHWLDRDPELKCQLPGVPRAMYMPYPYQIVQSTEKIHIFFAFSNAARVIHLDDVDPAPIPQSMGHSVGRWEGDTLVVEVGDFNGQTWFDRAGNFHSDALRLVERFTLIDQHAIQYEVTIEDPNVFTAALDNLDAAVSPSRTQHAGSSLPLHAVRGGVPVWSSSQRAACHPLGGETMIVEIKRPEEISPEASYERIGGR